MERSWILVGMMGAGKSAIGRSIASTSGRTFIDTDLLLQGRFGRPVGQIFEVYGERTFRDHETSILKSLEPGANIVSTGGGIVLAEANWAEFRRLGTTVYLNASVETLVARLAASKKKRPLLQGQEWESKLRQILEGRAALYGRADLCVNVTDCDIEQAAMRVVSAISEANS